MENGVKSKNQNQKRIQENGGKGMSIDFLEKEELVFEAYANYGVHGGKLYLTNQRLVYKTNLFGKLYIIPLKSISNVYEPFEVTTKSGESHSFRMYKSDNEKFLFHFNNKLREIRTLDNNKSKIEIKEEIVQESGFDFKQNNKRAFKKFLWIPIFLVVFIIFAIWVNNSREENKYTVNADNIFEKTFSLDMNELEARFNEKLSEKASYLLNLNVKMESSGNFYLDKTGATYSEYMYIGKDTLGYGRWGAEVIVNDGNKLIQSGNFYTDTEYFNSLTEIGQENLMREKAIFIWSLLENTTLEKSIDLLKELYSTDTSYIFVENNNYLIVKAYHNKNGKENEVIFLTAINKSGFNEVFNKATLSFDLEKK